MYPSYLLNKLLRSRLSFAVWCEPDTERLDFVASDRYGQWSVDTVGGLFSSKGFLFAPFDAAAHPFIWIPADITNEGDIPDNASGSIDLGSGIRQASPSPKHEYLEQAVTMVDQIRQGQYKKAILSRIVQYPVAADKLEGVFSQLCEKYPNAYVFCVYTPYTGLWMGATPELLLKYQRPMGSTVALAGTRQFSSAMGPGGEWRGKEMDEQAVVAEFISGVLSGYGVHDLSVTGPNEVRAGQVMHLKTTFDFRAILNDRQLARMVLDLYPTPAVSGFPKKQAMEAIARIETHDRSYYGGFMGFVDQGNCSCYVSLRCMRIDNQYANLYVGGGLTRGSVPEQEWEETVLKSQTLLSVLKNI
ncbi:MAG: chorismate-binding protein [Breznakibacter sp.]